MIERFFRWLMEPPEHKPIIASTPKKPEPSPEPPPKSCYQPPSGKELRLLLHHRDYRRSEKAQYGLLIDGREYRVAYIFTHSAWYSVAFTLNKMRCPSLTYFTRGRQSDEDMREQVMAHLSKNKRKKILVELRKKRKRRPN